MASEIKANRCYETSRKTNTRVNKVFEAAAKLVFESKPDGAVNGLCDKCMIL